MKRSLLAALLIAAPAVFSSSAMAQSTPGWYYGKVPTAGEFNAAFGKKQDYLGFLPLNQAGGSMTGKLYLFPSTTTQAGLNLGQGQVPGAPANGDVWMTSQGLFYQANGATVGPIGSGGGGGATFGIQVDALSVVSTNTLSNLTKSFNGNYAAITVNQGTFLNAGATPAFSVSGSVVIWNASNAGFSLTTGDIVTIAYTATAVPVVPTLGAGVSTALQTSVNASGGFVTYPVPIAAISGFGTGVAAALSNNVNAASGMVALDNSGSTTIPGNLQVNGVVQGHGINQFYAPMATRFGSP